jgi:hypothetical protein
MLKNPYGWHPAARLRMTLSKSKEEKSDDFDKSHRLR